MEKLKTIDDLLNSEFLIPNKLEKLLELAEIKAQDTPMTKNQMVNLLLYDSMLGLDEILNILFTEFELRKIWSIIDDGCNPYLYKKANIIGILISLLPPKKERRIETVIDEAVDDDKVFRPIIYYLFLMVPDGRAVFSFNFRPIEIGDLTMFTSALNGISILLEELTNRDRLENIELATRDTKDTELELIFEYGDLQLNYPEHKNLIGILLVNRESEKVRNKLQQFIQEFEDRYKNSFFPEWNGKISDFYSAKHIIYDVFTDYIEF
jgi:hypothetical protein